MMKVSFHFVLEVLKSGLWRNGDGLWIWTETFISNKSKGAHWGSKWLRKRKNFLIECYAGSKTPCINQLKGKETQGKGFQVFVLASWHDWQFSKLTSSTQSRS